MAAQLLNKKAVTLIIVVFAMMLLGVLGWTLARMQATNFESNLRTFEPENALNMAEAGAQWALNRLSADSSCRSQSGLLRCPPLASPAIDSDCDETGDWLTTPHSLSPGQYNLCVRDSCGTCSPAEDGDAIIVARGYIPAQSGSRVMRQIKLEVELGSLSNVLQTQIPDPDNDAYGLFNWTDSRSGHTVQMEGNIEAGHYESDGDGLPDELPPGNPGYDYDSQPSPILPDDIFSPENEARSITASYPSIEMDYFRNAPGTIYWPPGAADRPITAMATIVRDDGNLYLDTDTVDQYLQVTEVPGGFFSGMNNAAVRKTVVTGPSNTWWGDPIDDGEDSASDWRVISRVPVDAGGTRARIYNNPPDAGGVTWADEDPPDTDGRQVSIQLVRCFPPFGAGSSDPLRYVGGGAETLIDVTNSGWSPANFSLVSEGDIIIKGALALVLTKSAAGAGWPTLATKTGNIISKDQPAGGSEAARMDNREIAGLIYSEFGEIDFNYLSSPTAGGAPSRRRTLVYGQKVTLDGSVSLRYSSSVVPASGFIFKPTTQTWKEE